MKDIFMVITGEYSSTSAAAAFTTKEKADEFARAYGRHDCEIEKFRLDVPPGQWCGWEVIMDRAGRVLATYKFGPIGYMRTFYIQERAALIEGSRGYEFPLALTNPVYVDDEAAAIKATNELRGTLVANNLWASTRESPVLS